MARILISLLSVLLLLNVMTFLMVAFQDAGAGDGGTEGGKESSTAITGLTKKITDLTRKVDELNRMRSALTQLPGKVDNLTRKTDVLSAKVDRLASARRNRNSELASRRIDAAPRDEREEAIGDDAEDEVEEEGEEDDVTDEDGNDDQG